MKKKLRDVSFKEFDKWANEKACDGAWSINDSLNSAEAIRLVLKVRPLFGRNKAREKEWERIKNEYFKLDAEIEV